jgi:hypothetical protein
MEHSLELAYVGLEVPEPSTLDGLFGEVVGLVAGAPTAGRLGDLAQRRRRHQRIVVGRGDANDAGFVGFEALDGAAFDAVVAARPRRGVRRRGRGRSADDAVATSGRPRSPAPRHRGARRSSWSLGLETRRAVRLADDAGRVPDRGGGFGHAVFATVAFDESTVRDRRAGHGRSPDWLELEIAEGIELEVALLPLQRAPPHPRLGESAVRAAPAAAPHDVRDPRTRRRGRGVRPGPGVGAADPQRPRPSRQRPHVQLLRRARPASRSRSATALG